MVRRNLKALHLVLKEPVKFESESDKGIKEKSNICCTNVEDLSNGDGVIYKRSNSHESYRPGILIRQDEKKI